MHLFAQLVKVDEATRTVYGRAVQEVPDHSGEIFDYESSAPYFKSWSEDVAKITDGKSVGNVRAMHGKVAAGKLTELTGNDTEKAFDVAAQIVDDNEWKKCQEGVYTGFSIGGRYVKKWQDGDFTRYTAQPNEISLVDAPCVPTARFTVIKADGAEVEREFAAGEGLLKQHWFCGIDEHRHLAKDDARKCIGEQAIEKAERAVVVNSLEEPGDSFLSEGDQPEADDNTAEKADAPKGKTVGGKVFPASDWAYVPDPKKPSTWKLRMTAEPGGPPTSRLVAGCVAALGKGFRGNKVEIPEKDLPKVKARVRAAWRKVHKDGKEKMPEALKWQAGDLEKGMYGVANFARIIEDLDCLARCQAFEEEQEGDDSTMSAKLKTLLSTAGDLLVQMVQEETEELTEGDDVEVLSLSDKGEIEKLRINPERFPALCKALESSHANPTGDGSGTAPTASEVSMDEKAVQKLLEERDGKIAEHLKKIDSQESTIQEQGETIQKLNERLEKLEAGPAPAKGRRLVVSKGADAGDHTDNAADDGVDEMAEKLEKMSPEDRATLLIKVSQRHPSVVTE